MKVVVGLSGGVDSAVAAWLLQQQGHNVSALFMKNWDDDDGSALCTAREDFLSACQVADHLGIPLQSVSFSTEYKERVFTRFLADIRRGVTPNPDVLCNTEIKFDAFLHHALSLGYEKVATGHYARIVREGTVCALLTGVDERKDQTYFLHRLNQQQLQRAEFPLGELRKEEVRRLARQCGLPNHDRKDSTGICFIGERNFSDFLKRYLPLAPGDMVDEQGVVVGQHSGMAFYTIGQRKGLGIGGRKNGSEEPWYVADKDVANNRLLVVQGEHPLLYRESFDIHDMHWIDNMPVMPINCQVKIRYQQSKKMCTIFDRTMSDILRIRFRENSQRAVTPGQCAVLYLDEKCLGGGFIT